MARLLYTLFILRADKHIAGLAKKKTMVRRGIRPYRDQLDSVVERTLQVIIGTDPLLRNVIAFIKGKYSYTAASPSCHF